MVWPCHITRRSTQSARYLMIATGMAAGDLHRRNRPFGRFRYGSGRCRRHADLSNGMNVWLSILIALAVGLADRLRQRRSGSFLGLQPFITTLIMMLAGRGMAKVITSGENTDASAVAGNEPLKWFANGFIWAFPPTSSSPLSL